jgi:hypothetical protein
MPLLFQTPQHLIACNAVEIRGERAARRVEHLRVAHERHKNFLRHIFRDALRAAHL